jgi:glucuronoarabinoxylan endo-1,4-beta-xylanase
MTIFEAQTGRSSWPVGRSCLLHPVFQAAALVLALGLLGCQGSTGGKVDASPVVVPTAAADATATKAPTITVDTTKRQQLIEGFGGFGAAKVWWDPPPYFDQAWLDKLADLGVTIVRTEISHDFESEDRMFHLEPASANGQQLGYLQALQAMGVKILATAFTPPIWMKLDPDNSLAWYCNGQCGGTLDPGHYQDYADYLVEYVKEMHAAGVEIYALSIANEPLFANPWSTCVYTEQGYAEVLKLVGAAFAEAGLSTRLVGPEHIGLVSWNSGFFKSLLGDAAARNALDIYAVHMYTFDSAPDFGSAEGWTQLFGHVDGAGKQLWMTETGDTNHHEKWDEAFLMAKGLHLALRFGKVSAWLYWYMATDVLTDAPDNTPNPLYYALKQYYRYIRPGYLQVESATDDTDILPTAYVFGDGLTVVLINDGSTGKTATVKLGSDGTLPSFDAFRTSSSESAVAVGKISDGIVALPAKSITTLYAAATSETTFDGGGR